MNQQKSITMEFDTMQQKQAELLLLLLHLCDTVCVGIVAIALFDTEQQKSEEKKTINV